MTASVEVEEGVEGMGVVKNLHLHHFETAALILIVLYNVFYNILSTCVSPKTYSCN